MDRGPTSQWKDRSGEYGQIDVTHQSGTIERVESLSADELKERYVRTSTPVLMTGMLEKWPALEKWSLDYFQERFGSRLMTAGKTVDGSLIVSDKKGIPQVELEFGRYIELMRQGRPDYYLLSPIEERIPELRDDIELPELARRAQWLSTRFWLSRENTCSPLHRDWPENLFAQIIGRKKFILIDRRETRRVYSRPFYSGAPNFARVDAESPDLDRFPRFRDVPRMTFEVKPGELLYLPRMWWHQVRSLDLSASINLWFGSGFVGAVGRLSQIYAKLRRLRT